MTILDIMVTAVLAFNAFTGCRRGLIRILCDLCAIVGGVIIAIQTYPYGVALLQEYVGMKHTMAAFVSFLSIWAVVFCLFRLIGNLVNKVTKLSIVRPLNILGGAFFGGVKGFFYMLPILIPLSHTDFAFYQDSKIAKPLNAALGARLLTAHNLKAVAAKLNLERTRKKQTEKVINDPNLTKLREALENNDTMDVGDMLRGLER